MGSRLRSEASMKQNLPRTTIMIIIIKPLLHFTSIFSSDFESVFAQHQPGKFLSFDFYPKAVYFECKF